MRKKKKEKKRTEECKKEVFKNFSPFSINQLVLKKKKKKENQILVKILKSFKRYKI